MSPSQCLPQLSPSAVGVIKDYFTTFDKKMLAIPLRYEYTLATLSPVYLKGIDAYIYNAIEGVAFLELNFVLRFDKTKVTLPSYEEFVNGGYAEEFDIEGHDEQVFQEVLLVKHDIAKTFFEIEKESERELNEEEDPGRRRDLISGKRRAEYLALKERVDFDLEWVVERDYYSGNPRGGIDWRRFCFDYGEVQWLGNNNPAEEYYYLQAAIVVQGKK